MDVTACGALCFGFVIGWITYRTLRRREGAAALSDIATVLGAVGGAAVTKLFSGDAFGYYSIGLLCGFFLYLVIALWLYGRESVGGWMKGSQEGNGP